MITALGISGQIKRGIKMKSVVGLAGGIKPTIIHCAGKDMWWAVVDLLFLLIFPIRKLLEAFVSSHIKSL